MVTAAGNTVWHGGRMYPDRTLLPMTAMTMFHGGSPQYGDPENAQQTFYYMQGLYVDGTPYIDPWGRETTFLVDGDPVTLTGWTELGWTFPGDKRLLISSGPFTMEPWDDVNGNSQPDFGEPGVQVIVGALIIKAGADNLDAITNLRYVSDYTRYHFSTDFTEDSLPPPDLQATAADRELILSWHGNAAELTGWSSNGYAFEGYNLFQGT